MLKESTIIVKRPTSGYQKTSASSNTMLSAQQKTMASSNPPPYESRYGTFYCNVDKATLSPFQNCINVIAAFCYTESPIFSSWSDCHAKVLEIKSFLNTGWKRYIDSCAGFAGGNSTSSQCMVASAELVAKEYYCQMDSQDNIKYYPVPNSLVSSASFIWNT